LRVWYRKRKTRSTQNKFPCRDATRSQLVCQFQHTRISKFRIFCSAEISWETLASLISKTENPFRSK